MNNPLKDLKKPVNILGEEYYNAYPDESKILIEFSKDEGSVTILGHKLDRTYKSFEEFLEYLETLFRLQEENKRLIEELRQMRIDRAEFISYLEERLEESKLDRYHIDGLTFASMHEGVYQKILDKYCKKDESE